MACFTATKVFNFAIWSSVFLMTMVVISVSSYQFQVGGDRGWVKPKVNEPETYNDWAAENRFHVGDKVYFKYRKDSVLVVDKSDYENCVLSNAISKFTDGNTVFQFDRYGYFYFISGQPGHCKAGQKLIIRVMVHPEVDPPGPAPSSTSGGGGSHGGESGDWGPPATNATTKLSVVSFFVTALGCTLVILYMFM